MNELTKNYEITPKDLYKDKALTYTAWSAPLVFSIIPSLIVFLLGFFSANPVLIFLSLFLLIGGFVLGLATSAVSLVYRSRWWATMRERLAIDGIKTEEVRFFMHELKSTEKKSLKELEASNLLLADAYRETLATRLTSTRILKSAKQEILLVQRRQSKLKQLKGETSDVLLKELDEDKQKLEKLKNDSEQMRIEAETRLQMIEAASRRGTSFVDSETALKKLTAHASELPLALQALKMEDELRKELGEN
jgi:hypothetical protein